MSNYDHVMNKKATVMVEWVDLGEGLDGDYDPSDPNDIHLLRFDVSVRRGREWFPVDDASYCTQVPASTPGPEKLRLLKFLLSEVAPEVEAGHSIKKLCERLSWIDVSWGKAVA